MEKRNLAGIAFAAIILATVATVAALSVTPPPPLNFTSGVVNHPPGCDVATDKRVTAGGLTLMVETTANPSLSSPVCLHFVLFNNSTQPFPAYEYIMVINVTSSSGKVVYHQDWGIVSPPGSLFNITKGNFWEDGTFWHPSQSLAPVVAGDYRISAVLLSTEPNAAPTISESTSVSLHT